MPLKRITITVDPEVYYRVRDAVAELPGLSISEVIRDCLEEVAPYLEAVALGVRTGDQEATIRAFGHATGDALLRTVREMEAEKE